MDTPVIHVDRVELRGDACLKDALVHLCGHSRTVIEDDKRPSVTLSGGGDVDVPGAGVSSVSEKLDERIFYASNVVGRLTTLGLRDSKPNKAIAKTLLNTKGFVSPHGGDKAHKV